MESAFTIRPAVLADANRMEACAARAYADVLSRLDGLPDVVGGMAQELAENSGLIAEHGQELAGFVIFKDMPDAVKVANLACNPAFAGLGVARRLLDGVAVIARMAGKGRLDLVTHAGMTETQAFYRHLGWRETGRAGQGVFFSLPL